MDEIGRRYLLLAMRLGRHQPDLAHAYIGPAELGEAIEGEPPTPAFELHDEALRLREMAEALKVDSPEAAARQRFLRTQLIALGAIARIIGGEEIAFVDRAEQLLDARIESEVAATFEAARRELDRHLPGAGSLAERIAVHDAAMGVPPGSVVPTMERFATLLRRRCAQVFRLPPNESVEWVAVRDRPWTAFARYLGGGRSRIEINLDVPFTLRRILHFAAHEAYPGHHLERSTKEIALARVRDLGEAMIVVAATPESLVHEGAAEQALQVLLFGRAVVDAAIGRNRDGWSIEATRDYLAEVALVGEARANRGATLLDDPIRGVYLLCYPFGEQLVGDWLAVTGQKHGYARLLREQITPGGLRAEIGEPAPLYSGDMV